MYAQLYLSGIPAAAAVALGCLAGVVVLIVVLLIVGRLAARCAELPEPAVSRPDVVRRPASGGLPCGLCFLLFWSANVAVFDAFLSYGAVRQLLARSYPVVEGEVLRCNMRSFDATATSNAFNVEYAYEAQGRRYTGDRAAYFRMWSQKSARQFVAGHSPGSRCPVHYNPSDPADAVLVPGVGGDVLFMDLFLTPFNLVMVGGWYWLIASFWRRRSARLVLPVGTRLLDQGTQLRVRLPRVPPLMGAALTVFVASFFAIFPVVFLCDFSASPAIVLAVQGLILGAALWVYVLLAIRTYSGKTDLVINLLDGVLVLPPTFGRKEPVVVAFSDLAAVDVMTIANSQSNSSYQYAPTVRWREPSGTIAHAKLAEWNEEQQAQDFAAWLREQVGLALPADAWSRPVRRHEAPRRWAGR